MADDITTIADLHLDQRNARKRGLRASGMLEASLQEVGAARSIVIDEQGNILAGNGTVEAAGQVGIERVQVVDADGETIVAVRRSGLTKAQKQRLSLLDNRTGELAEWEPEVLAELAQEGVPLDDLWSTEELDALLAAARDADWGDSIGALPEGDRAPFQQMTFTLSDAQAETVKAAIEAAKHAGDFADTGNENSNGNAIARICETYVR